jgi:hypothetical protein
VCACLCVRAVCVVCVSCVLVCAVRACVRACVRVCVGGCDHLMSRECIAKLGKINRMITCFTIDNLPADNIRMNIV